jgi:hypothetical protein
MRRRRKPILLILTLLAGAAMIQVVSLRSPGQSGSGSINQRQEAVDYIPLVDYDPSKSTDRSTVDEQMKARRQAVGNRHDKQFLVKRSASTNGLPVLTLSHWNESLPALPAALSDSVVLGEVTGAEAHLSNDKSGVYSEFTVLVQEVLKDNRSTPVFPGDVITTERRGGRVRVPSGRIIRYGIAGQDMPRQGQRYLFFLKTNEQQYSIVTAYQLVSGRVRPLDGQNAPSPPGLVMSWAGDAYEGADAARFLDEVKNAIAESSRTADR